MSLKEPTSTDECIYFTQRSINNCHTKCWVFKESCPKCGKALLSKPRNEKTGKPKRRKFNKDEVFEILQPNGQSLDTAQKHLKYLCFP